jgi:deazaflavin-dependent oxidoreductase (nitroreductase family)
MTHLQHAIDRPPAFVRWFDPIMRKLLSIGMPAGPNTLLTVRGRKSGVPRQAAVALVEVGGRTWVMGAYGNVQWVANLRHAREGTIRVKGGAQRHVQARPLSTEEAAAFFREVLAPYAGRLPWYGRLTAKIIVGEMLKDPDRAARDHPVFELLPG